MGAVAYFTFAAAFNNSKQPLCAQWSWASRVGKTGVLTPCVPRAAWYRAAAQPLLPDEVRSAMNEVRSEVKVIV